MTAAELRKRIDELCSQYVRTPTFLRRDLEHRLEALERQLFEQEQRERVAASVEADAARYR
jgi:hypothetical protein